MPKTVKDELKKKRTVKCNECGEHFPTPHQKIRHAIAAHAYVPQHVCPEKQCGKWFASPAHLKTHISAIHKKERPYICTEKGCDGRFDSKPHLRDHQDRIHKHIKKPRPTQPCHHCSERFSTVHQRITHEL